MSCDLHGRGDVQYSVPRFYVDGIEQANLVEPDDVTVDLQTWSHSRDVPESSLGTGQEVQRCAVVPEVITVLRQFDRCDVSVRY